MCGGRLYLGQILCFKTSERSHERREGKDFFFSGGLADKETKAQKGKSFHGRTAGGWSGQIAPPPSHLPSEPLFTKHVLCAAVC